MSQSNTPLLPAERELVGGIEADPVRFDAVALRILHLVEHELEHLANDSSGWQSLFRDPRDGRLWERSYDSSHMHGGGPPSLRVLDAHTAAERYGFES